MPNLELLLPTTANLSANESANSLILVATKTDIKRMLKIVGRAGHIHRQCVVHPGHSAQVCGCEGYRYPDHHPVHFAERRAKVAAPAEAGRGNLFSMLGRRRVWWLAARAALAGGPGGGGGGSGGSGGGAAGAKVVAVGDDRSNSLVISAPADLLATIENMVKEIDQEVTDVTELRVFRLVNADPTEIADQLAQLFPDPTTSSSGSSTPTTPFSFFRGGFGGRRGKQPPPRQLAATG